MATVAGITAAMVVTTCTDREWRQLERAGISAVVCGGFYLLLARFLSGDVSWPAVLALACGWFGVRTAVTGLAAGVALAAIAALILVILRRVHRNTGLRFGSFLSVGALAAFVVHEL